MSAQDAFDKNMIDDNVVNQARDTKSRVAQLEVAGNNSLQQGDDVVGSRIIATTNPENAEPTDSGFDGTFVAATEQEMADGTQDSFLARVIAGIVQLSLGIEGFYFNSLANGYKHIANDGTTYRKGLLGMTTLSGRTAPSFGLTYQDNSTPTELLTNGGFETGDFTGWTAVSGTWSVQTASPHAGTYYAVINGGGGAGEKSQVVPVTSSSTYLAQAAIYGNNSRLTVEYYSTTDGTGSIISSGEVIHTEGNVWVLHELSTFAPATAQSVKFRIRTTAAANVFFDTCSFVVVSMENHLGFEPIKGKVVSKMQDASNALGQIPVGAMTILRIEEAKDKLVATPGAAGNVNVGTHGVVTTFVDQYGETDADLSQASTAVVATSAKTVALSAIPIGKWGTTSRKVYGAIAGATITDPAAYYLITTIGDNTTTTGTYNISDATLITGTQLPTVNTTGSRPSWPRTANVLGMQITTNGAGSVTGQLNSSGYLLGYVFGLTAAEAADGDEYYFSVMLEAGAYTVYTDGGNNPSAGKVDWYIDNVLATSGQDWYAAAAAVARKSFTYTITTSGYHHVCVKVNGKNASSTDYRWLWSVVTFVPSVY